MDKEKLSLVEFNKFNNLLESGTLAPTKNVMEALRRKYFLKGTKKDNRMIFLGTPSMLKKKDQKYFKPYSKTIPRVNNWWDATDELVEFFNEFELKINLDLLSENHKNLINHRLFNI